MGSVVHAHSNPDIVARDIANDLAQLAKGAAPTSAMREETRHSGLTVKWGDAVKGVPAMRRVNLAIKRVMDVTGALAGLLLFAPLLIVVAVSIKMTGPGPVLFRQKREGLGGRIFEVFKFRSMRIEAGDESGLAQTLEDDPRVTAIGRFIRRTSLDELPQLINVLLGDMSLVGPRPHVPGMMSAGQSYRSLVPYYHKRLDMLPGITGWAQVNGLRGSTRDRSKAIERVNHDIAYIQNFSVLLDIKIVALTIFREFFTGTGR